MKRNILLKYLSAILSVLLMISIIPFSAYAVDDEVEVPYTYYLIDNKAIITDYVNENITGTYSIPSTIDDYPVIGIEQSSICVENASQIIIPSSIILMGIDSIYNCFSNTAFIVESDNPYFCSDSNGVLYAKDMQTLISYPIANIRTSYTVPSTVINILPHAFCYASSLETIFMPNSIKSIGTDAFFGTACLDETEFENGVKYIGTNAVCCDGNSTTLSFKDGTRIIADGIASEYTITSVVLPQSLVTVGQDSFSYCSNLSSVNFPDSLVNIGDNAFAYCPLTKVSLGKNIEYMTAAFAGCQNLTSITIDAQNPNFTVNTDGAVYSKDMTTLICVPAGNVISSFSIPASVTTINDSAFECSSIEYISIPNTVKIISQYAFYSCTELENVSLAEGIQKIGNSAFSFCTSLTTVVIPSSITYLDSFAFLACNNLTRYVIKPLNNINYLGDYMFGFTCDENGENDEYFNVNNVKIYCDSSNIICSYAEYYGIDYGYIDDMLGNLTNDDEVNSADALYVLQMDVGMKDITPDLKVRADVNFDSKVNSSDALKILKYTVGLIDSIN